MGRAAALAPRGALPPAALLCRRLGRVRRAVLPRAGLDRRPAPRARPAPWPAGGIVIPDLCGATWAVTGFAVNAAGPSVVTVGNSVAMKPCEST